MDRLTADVFLHAIAEAPDDDTPRLVYADWLEDHGDEDFARFIRLQCVLERSPHGEDWLARKRAEDELWGRLKPRWQEALGPLRCHLSLHNARRGLLVILGSSVSLDSGPVARLPACPFLLEVRLLDVSGDHDAGWPRFIAESHWWPVRALELRRSGIQDEHLTAFAEAYDLSRLGLLDLGMTFTSPTGLASLLRCPSLTGLRSLALDHTPLGPEGVSVLVGAPALTALRYLDLSDTGVGDEGLDLLAQWPGLAAVEELRLGENEVTQAGLIALARSPYVRSVRTLALGDNPCLEGDEANEGEGLMPLLRPAMPALETIDY